MAEHTLSYSADAQGFPSFYSFIPEKMVGINNYFYSFKNGQLYRHNTNANRAQFYGSFFDCTVTGIFNAKALETKLFKTIEIQSDTKWKCDLETDLLGAAVVASDGEPQKASIEKDYFETKEGNQFAFIRYLTDDVNFLIRYANGIANCTTVTNTGGTSYDIAFAPTIEIDSILSVGDTIYSPGVSPSGVKISGTVTGVDRQTNIITINVVAPVVQPNATDFIMYVKNTVAESHGIRGHYMKYTLTSTDKFASEVFAVESEVFKSYP